MTHTVREGDSSVTMCSACGYEVVTSLLKPWMMNPGPHELWVELRPDEGVRTYVGLSKLVSENAVQIRDSAGDGPFLFATGSWTEMEALKEKVDELGASCEVRKVKDP